MLIELRRRYTVDAAHKLGGLEAGHPCAELHGHRFEVEIAIAGEPDATGMVLDLRALDRRMAPLIETLDHHYLNDVEGLEQPTMENIACWLARRIDASPARLVAVCVRESERSRAVFRPGPEREDPGA